MTELTLKGKKGARAKKTTKSGGGAGGSERGATLSREEGRVNSFAGGTSKDSRQIRKRKRKPGAGRQAGGGERGGKSRVN